MIATEHHRPSASVIMGQRIHINNQKKISRVVKQYFFEIITIEEN
ncbi:hypothetical protein SynSYN20_02681 [Synechococcus sp. SYN20]|nr:hypothetical protein SynSYN20_02681 [Synechococcus sp. SYN20]